MNSINFTFSGKTLIKALKFLIGLHSSDKVTGNVIPKRYSCDPLKIVILYFEFKINMLIRLKPD
jgi:hypothetical protein